ncbi:hypothetical protein PFICI_08912 [Pestalotiopsis fici W106-1]|uniref:Transcription factor domain-containing protein n=1 Tax=Pestalotiopsis fici (strain W106-1 / CGMCC3.15140) TaxID=1229662 RepID=W3WZ52_PESFW|nr:uncharacterized protein PFICI_08912 [Pestalotiopsis fici W106-1]ETS79059.1 hypothetical protein PFICI_08912 [Pestalotiopsis fici W106-1]
MRCLKANRCCSGYEVHGTADFRSYEPRDQSQIATFSSMARKCTLPKRTPIPGTRNDLPDDSIPPETTDAQSNAFCLRAFYYDFCVVSTNEHISQGFLPGIEKKVRRLGPKSDLARACQAVGFVSHAKPLNRPAIMRKSEAFYQELLGSLARAIDDPVTEPTKEAKSIAMLLGLYQMMIASSDNHGAHEIHAKGLSALMKVKHLPGNDFNGEGSSFFKQFHLDTIFCIPSLRGPTGSLGDLLSGVEKLYSRNEHSIGTNDVAEIKKDAMALSQLFSEWQNTRPLDFRPTTAGVTYQRDVTQHVPAGLWPGNLDTYFDLYVAGIWNIFRTAQLLLLALILRLPQDPRTACHDDHYLEETQTIFQEIAASIPYHLTDSLPAFINDLAKTSEITDTGKHLGGLLLLHPLYVLTQMPYLHEPERQYARECLLWIGSNMGLGQATVLAHEPNLDKEYVLSGCMIIWSGFLS